MHTIVALVLVSLAQLGAVLVLYNFLCGCHFCICVGGAYKAVAATAAAVDAAAACCPFTIDYSQSVPPQLLLLFASQEQNTFRLTYKHFYVCMYVESPA